MPLFTSDKEHLYLRAGVPLVAPLTAIWREAILDLGVFAVLVLAILFLGWWLSHRLILRPIRVLTQTAGRLGSGEMSARTGLAKSGGEIGKLARRFDEMAEQLQIQKNALNRISRVQSMRSAINSAMIRAENENALLADICDIICQVGGYQMTWVAYVNHDVTGDKLEAKAHRGADQNLLAALLFSDGDNNELDVGPVISAVRSGTVQVFKDLAFDITTAPWRQAIAQHGLVTAIGLPIRVEQQVIGALAIFSIDSKAFCSEEVQLLTESVSDLAFGISALRATLQVRSSQEFLGSVVNNIPSMVFVKDIASMRFISLNPAGEVMVPMGDWAKSRLKNLSDTDKIRDNSRVGSGFGKNISNWLTRDKAFPTNVLHLATECSNKNHSATFPEELPAWFMKLFTKEKDTVLDPFMGSGTTILVAARMKRHSIGIDIVPEYYEMVKEQVKPVEFYLLEPKAKYDSAKNSRRHAIR